MWGGFFLSAKFMEILWSRTGVLLRNLFPGSSHFLLVGRDDNPCIVVLQSTPVGLSSTLVAG